LVGNLARGQVKGGFSEQSDGIKEMYYSLFTYYLVLKFKAPILDFGTTLEVTLPTRFGKKKRTFKTREELDTYQKENFKTVDIKSYNNYGFISLKGADQCIKEIKLHINKGENQLLFFMGLKGRKSKGSNPSLHSNMVLIRVNEKRLYIIDPHGKQTVGMYKNDYEEQQTICVYLAKQLGYTLVKSDESIPDSKYSTVQKRGFQAIENMYQQREGYCGWWNCFIMELCFLHPTVPLDVIYKQALDIMDGGEPYVVLQVIQNYQRSIQNIISELGKKAGLPVDDATTPSLEVCDVMSDVLTTRLTALKGRRKELLGYAKI
jgi:hypothetical protein